LHCCDAGAGKGQRFVFNSMDAASLLAAAGARWRFIGTKVLARIAADLHAQNFSWKLSANAYHQIYRDLISR